MRSMTGYGKGIAESDCRKITVEIRSVNHRFLDIALKIPRNLLFCEDIIKRVIADHGVVRGHLDVYMTYEDNRCGKEKISLNMETAKKYMEIAETLKAEGAEYDMTTSVLMKMPEVITLIEQDDDETEILSLAENAANIAVENLVSMREKEGEILRRDFVKKLNDLESIADKIKQRAPLVSQNYAEKLRNRIEEALKGVELDEARLLNETAFFVDKANIDEEITRLYGHIEHGRSILKESGSIGKKLDFLVQEMNREVNTTGSKSNDLLLTEYVLEEKNLVEMIREQVQNVE